MTKCASLYLLIYSRFGKILLYLRWIKVNKSEVRKVLKEVYESLTAGSFDAVSQIVGYLSSGDPGYIPSINNARNKIIALDRSAVIEVLLKEYIK